MCLFRIAGSTHLKCKFAVHETLLRQFSVKQNTINTRAPGVTYFKLLANVSMYVLRYPLKKELSTTNHGRTFTLRHLNPLGRNFPI